jgi:hypothetical protein
MNKGLDLAAVTETGLTTERGVVKERAGTAAAARMRAAYFMVMGENLG